jgi:leucyl aminopeptidase
MQTKFISAKLDRLSSPLLVIFALDTAEKKQTNPAIKLLTAGGALAKVTAPILNSGEFAAGSCETVLLHGPDGLKAERILLIGVAKLTAAEVRKAAGAAVRYAKPRKLRELTIAIPEGLDTLAAAKAVVEGAYIGDFDSDTYRSDRKDQSIEQLSVVSGSGVNQAAIEAGIREGVILGEAQNFARALINEPGNVMTPTVLGQRAAEMCRQNGLQCEVYGADKIKELKMGAFWGVTKGSEEPPALIVMTYEPKKAPASPVLGLVGKGITFDTGGISIKPSEGMEKMKYDMAGGAAMIGAMQAIAQLKPAVKVIGIVCAAENMPSGSAMKPGDVLIAMSGKSIEVVNTDAEGRLVLADGLAYARQLGATHLIDAATLTGACVVALGQVNAGCFTNDEDAYKHFVEAAGISGERFWRLPLEDDYKDQIKSNIADIMNTGVNRYGGATNAAMFLKEFAEDTPWIHLDIAGLAWSDDAKPWMAKGPSGIAMRTITEWVRSYAK